MGQPRLVASTVGTIGMLADGGSLYQAVRLVATAIAVVVALYAAWIARTHRLLVRGCAMSAVVYFLVASPLFWAWYLLLPIVLLILARDFALVFVLTAASRLVAPLDLLRLRTGISWAEEAWLTTVIGVWLPLAFLAWRRWRRSVATTPAASSSTLPRARARSLTTPART
jgi:hypothetical protein